MVVVVQLLQPRESVEDERLLVGIPKIETIFYFFLKSIKSSKLKIESQGLQSDLLQL